MDAGKCACMYVCIYVCPVSFMRCLPPFFLQGIKAVLAESYERIHRSNLVGMGVIPLQFLPGQSPESLGLTGRESYTITLPPELTPGMMADVSVSSIHTHIMASASVVPLFLLLHRYPQGQISRCFFGLILM